MTADPHWFRHSLYFKSFVLYCIGLAATYAILVYLLNFGHVINVYVFIILWAFITFILWGSWEYKRRQLNKDIQKIMRENTNVILEVEYKK